MISKSDFRDFVNLDSIKYFKGEGNDFGSSGYYGLFEIPESDNKNSKYKRINSAKCFVFIKRALTWIEFLTYKKEINDFIKNEKLIDGDKFIPNKKHRNEYFVNNLIDEIKSLENYWDMMQNKLFKKIRTPGEAAQDAWTNSITSGYMDVDDASAHKFVEMMKRERQYGFVMYSLLIQVIHQIASRYEYALVKGLKIQGEEFNNFDRGIFYNIIKKRTGIEFKDIEYSNKYTELIVLWNFLKHNNKSSFDKVKLECPQFLGDINDEYLDRGTNAMSYIKIDFDTINEILKGIKEFSFKLSVLLYQEDYEIAKWNYYDFFLDAAYDTYLNEFEPKYL